MLLARQASVGREGMPFAQSAQTAFDKIATLLPPKMRDYLEQGPVVYASSGRRDYAHAPWGQLLSACQKGERLEAVYYSISSDTTSTRRMDPYHIVWFGSFCHLIAYCHKNRTVRNFALDGFRQVRLTGEFFTIPADFSLKEYMRGVSGPILGELTEIVIRFHPELARWARRRTWEFPHELTDEPDGAVLLRGTVRGLSDIRKELLTWGAKVRVLEPDVLRETLLAEAQSIVSLYTS